MTHSDAAVGLAFTVSLMWAIWPKDDAKATRLAHVSFVVLAMILMQLLLLSIHIEDKGIIVVTATPTSESAK